jgi:ElaB/YqjD/DUF883 family membrane-anchored ribosome-binding protein
MNNIVKNKIKDYLLFELNDSLILEVEEPEKKPMLPSIQSIISPKKIDNLTIDEISDLINVIDSILDPRSNNAVTEMSLEEWRSLQKQAESQLEELRKQLQVLEKEPKKAEEAKK